MPSPDLLPSFSWNAADYHKSSPAQHHWTQELIAKPGLSGTSRVLDIGCRDRKITAEIARNPAGRAMRDTLDILHNAVIDLA